VYVHFTVKYVHFTVHCIFTSLQSVMSTSLQSVCSLHCKVCPLHCTLSVKCPLQCRLCVPMRVRGDSEKGLPATPPEGDSQGNYDEDGDDRHPHQGPGRCLVLNAGPRRGDGCRCHCVRKNNQA